MGILECYFSDASKARNVELVIKNQFISVGSKQAGDR
jgi:hypothetical protein